jgi:pilus assembly protein CpaE
MTDLRILLATPHAGYEQRLRRAFGEHLNGEVQRWDLQGGDGTPGELLAQLASSVPDVVAIGPDVELEAALILARQLEQDRPEISVLLISEPAPELWQDALRAGVRDVIPPDAPDVDVRAAFDRVMEVAARRRQNLIGDDDAGRGGRIITIVSPKGGSGKTTVASNLAVGLALAEPNQVVLVDLDLQFGDVATSLRLTPNHTLVDAMRVSGQLDGMALKSFLTAHPTNLWALCGPESPAEGEEVSADRAQQVVRILADEFRYVVVDTSAGLSEHTLSVLEISTDLILLCAMDVPSIRSLRKEIDALDQLGMTHLRRSLVINRADSKVGLDVRDVEASIGMPVDIAIGSSRSVPLSLNQGTPLIESEPRSPVARQLLGLVERFVEQPAPQVTRRRRGGRR